MPWPAWAKCDQRLRRGAFEQHARPDMRNVAGSLEPAMRRKAWCETQQRLVGKLRYIERRPAAQAVALRQHGQDMHWIEQPAAESIVAGWHDGDVDVATFEAARQSGSAVLDQMNLDTGVALAVARQELREQSLDRPAGWLRRAALRLLRS